MSGAPIPTREEGELAVFERFNRAQGLGRVRDPYPAWAALRREGPVHPLLPGALLGRPGVRLPFMPESMVLVVGYEAAVRVLRDGTTFSSAGYERTIGQVMGPTILAMDGAAHAARRALLQPAFTRGALARVEREIVTPIVHRLLDRIAGRERVDLVPAFTFPFPVAVIAAMIGLPEAEHARFHRLAVELISVAFDPARGLAASRGLRELLAPHLEARRRAPRDDLLTRLVQARPEGEPLDEEEIFGFLRLLAPAGAETTYRSTSNLLFGLLTHPDQLAAVRADPRLVPAAVEEALRWECPITVIFRTATRDAELGGLPAAAGTGLAVCLAAANRDPSRWEDPDRFDLRRVARPHAAFAAGPHTCLGLHLARMEMRVALQAVLERLPELRLDPEAGDVHVTGLTFRSPLALPVLPGRPA